MAPGKCAYECASTPGSHGYGATACDRSDVGLAVTRDAVAERFRVLEETGSYAQAVAAQNRILDRAVAALNAARAAKERTDVSICKCPKCSRRADADEGGDYPFTTGPTESGRHATRNPVDPSDEASRNAKGANDAKASAKPSPEEAGAGAYPICTCQSRVNQDDPHEAGCYFADSDDDIADPDDDDSDDSDDDDDDDRLDAIMDETAMADAVAVRNAAAFNRLDPRFATATGLRQAAAVTRLHADRRDAARDDGIDLGDEQAASDRGREAQADRWLQRDPRFCK